MADTGAKGDKPNPRDAGERPFMAPKISQPNTPVNTPENATAGLLRVCEVAHALGCSERYVYKMRDMGAMPAPIRVAGKTLRWRKSEIESWIADGCPKPKVGADE